MRRSESLLLFALLSLAGTPAFACYTVYDRTNHILYQGEKAPVDMSLPLHEALQQRYPGGQLVFDETAQCPATISSLAIGNGGPITRTSSPLLTDEKTARAMHLPHRVVNGVAVVPAANVAMRPGVTVVPGAPTVASKSVRSDTSVLGYGIAPVTGR